MAKCRYGYRQNRLPDHPERRYDGGMSNTSFGQFIPELRRKSPHKGHAVGIRAGPTEEAAQWRNAPCLSMPQVGKGVRTSYF
jgi:hypothetical protein